MLFDPCYTGPTSRGTRLPLLITLLRFGESSQNPPNNLAISTWTSGYLGWCCSRAFPLLQESFIEIALLNVVIFMCPVYKQKGRPVGTTDSNLSSRENPM